MRYIFFPIFLFITLCSAGQQGLQSDFNEIDSAQIELNRQLEYFSLISGNVQSDLLNEKIVLPGFNIQQEIQKRYAFSLEAFPLNNLTFAGISSGPFGAYSPFYHNGTILSEAAYQIGNKLIIGGYSYGANFIHAAPYPNQNSSYFDTYGSTMFMQYKVSKNFKIETRVSVGQRQRPGM